MEITSFSLNHQITETECSVFRPALKKINTVSAIQRDTSPLAQISTAYGLTELSVQGAQTSYSYRKDGSLALQANSTRSYTLNQQTTDVELQFSADFFDPDTFAADAFQNGSLSFDLNAWDQTLTAETTTTIKVVRPIRKVEDILGDISQGIREILNRKGDKNLRLVLDGEAIQALASDKKMQSLMNELTGLICVINGLAVYGGKRDFYTLLVSGKGNPYLDAQKETQIKATVNQVHFKVTITAPSANSPVVSANLSSDAAEEIVMGDEDQNSL